MIRNNQQIPQMQRTWSLPYGQSLSCKIGAAVAVTAPKAELCIPLDGERVGAYRHVSLTLTLDGEGTYAPCVFCLPTGEIVDYALVRGEESTLPIEATVSERNGQPCLVLALVEGAGETLTVNAVATADPIPETALLGGAELIMIDPRHKQMMGFILRTAEGKILVFDGGNEPDADHLGDLLISLGGEIDGWFITHYHNDHVAAIVGAIEKYDLHVKTFYRDFRGSDNPNFIGDGDNRWIGHVEDMLVRYRGTKIDGDVTTNRGDLYDFGSVRVRVLNDAIFYEDEDNPGNDSGVVFKIETPGESILMLGDVGWTRGDLCLEDEWFVEQMRTCRIVQMAHHGQNGTTERFYRTIDDIQVCLYCADQWLFDVDRRGRGFGSGPWETLHTRAWMRRLGVPYTYTTTDGIVSIR